MTDRELMQMALDCMEAAIKAGDWKVDGACDPDFVFVALRAALANEFNPDWDQVEALQESLREHMAEIQRLRAALAQPEQEPVATLFGSLPVYDVPPKQEPVAWRTFDGEGGYEFRSYEMNENYAEDWAQRNPNHKGWVEPLYKDPTPCQTCESLARTVMMDQTSHDTAPPQREWQGLTQEEVRRIVQSNTDPWCDTPETDGYGVAEMVESKLREKNGNF